MAKKKLKESTDKDKKLRASQNLAKDVETPKLKRIDIPNVAKAEIIRVNQEMENYIAGVVAGMGLKGRWSIDMRKMQFIVESNNDKKA